MRELYKARDSNISRRLLTQAYLGKTVGLVLDHHNEVSVAMMQVIIFMLVGGLDLDI